MQDQLPARCLEETAVAERHFGASITVCQTERPQREVRTAAQFVSRLPFGAGEVTGEPNPATHGGKLLELPRLQLIPNFGVYRRSVKVYMAWIRI
jgi:hypothetical protein